MAPVKDGEGSSEAASKALRRRKRRRVDREAGQREEVKKGKKRSTRVVVLPSEASPPPPPPPPPVPFQRQRAADDGYADVRAMVGKQVRQILATHDAKKKLADELLEEMYGERTLSVEYVFDDCDDGSTENLEARKVALRVSQSIVSLSSFAGGKRIRVCSGFVMPWNDSADTSMIITSATLVRSLNGENKMVPDLMVKVLLPNGSVVDGHIVLVDFHYNIAVVKVSPDLKLLEVSLAKDIFDRGDVLALGRSYEGGNLMCARGQIINRTSIIGCSELLVSSCEITMAGVGGPLFNYNGDVLGINFYQKNRTPYLSIAIVSRILQQHQSFGKIIHPWLGLRYTSLQALSLRVLEKIYQKFPDVDNGLYISDVVEGSPADVAGLCVGDILVKCGGEALSSAPDFGAVLLDTCKEQLEYRGWGTTGDCTGDNIMVEVVIKQQRDGSTMSKNIAAEVMKELHYSRWPAPMPSYRLC